MPPLVSPSVQPGLGLALIGCGEVTRAKHLPALRGVPGIRVLALADPAAARREQVANAFRVRYRVADVESAVALDGIAAVAVATPPDQHAAVALAALAAGKHVWIDKPLALTAAECLAVMNAARAAGAVVMTGFHMRYHRLIRELRAVVSSGRLGRIESIRSVWNSPRDGSGLPEWRWRRATGGGALIEIGVHHFDLWRFLLDTEVAQVYASSRAGERDDENAIVAAELANGVLASATLSERTSHEIEVEICGSEGRIRASCLRFEGLEFMPRGEAPGSLRARLQRGAHLLSTLPQGMMSLARGGEYRDSYRAAWAQFARMAQGKTPAECGALDGLRATEVVLAALASREARAPVQPVHHIARSQPEPAPSHTNAVASPLFSVVVPTFNRPANLTNLLQALANQRFPRERFEVIVVDDGSRESLAGVLAPFRERLALTLVERGHRGCAGARHAGAGVARGEWLVFTDDDCRPIPTWLTHLERRCRATPDCAIGGLVINGLPRNAYSEATQLTLACLDERLNPPGACRFFTTSNIAFPAAGYARIGGLDAGWPIAGGEDRDLCERWLQAGYRLVRGDDCLVLHCHQLSLRSFWRQHFNYGRGAHLYRARCAQHSGSPPGLEALRFYLTLPLYPLRRHRGMQAVLLAVLMALGQAANTLGFARQAIAAARARARSSVPSRVTP